METATELKHMVDISVGVDHHIVDFNMLNSLLHIIVSRLCSCSMNHTAIVESQGK